MGINQAEMKAIDRTLIRQQISEELSVAVEAAIHSYADTMAEVNRSATSLAPNNTLGNAAESAQPKTKFVYAKQPRKNKERAAQVIKTGTIVDSPCEKCKIRQKTDAGYQCLRDESISALCQNCVKQQCLCSANPYTKKRPPKSKGGASENHENQQGFC